jgi:hypothetical protein
MRSLRHSIRTALLGLIALVLHATLAASHVHRHPIAPVAERTPVAGSLKLALPVTALPLPHADTWDGVGSAVTSIETCGWPFDGPANQDQPPHCLICWTMAVAGALVLPDAVGVAAQIATASSASPVVEVDARPPIIVAAFDARGPPAA